MLANNDSIALKLNQVRILLWEIYCSKNTSLLNASEGFFLLKILHTGDTESLDQCG